MLNIQSALLEKTYLLYFILRLDLEQQCKGVSDVWWRSCHSWLVVVNIYGVHKKISVL